MCKILERVGHDYIYSAQAEGKISRKVLSPKNFEPRPRFCRTRFDFIALIAPVTKAWNSGHISHKSHNNKSSKKIVTISQPNKLTYVYLLLESKCDGTKKFIFYRSSTLLAIYKNLNTRKHMQGLRSPIAPSKF